MNTGRSPGPTPCGGLEAAFVPFNVALGLFLVFLARVLGALYLVNNIDHPELEGRTRRAAFTNLLWSLPFLLFVLYRLVTMEGFAVNPPDRRGLHGAGQVPAQPARHARAASCCCWPAWSWSSPAWSATSFLGKNRGIWFGGLGTVLVGLSLFLVAGLNNTAFYPSKADLASSLTIHNASSSHYTLTAMTYIALAVPFVLGYIAYVWRAMDAKRLSAADLEGEGAEDLY